MIYTELTKKAMRIAFDAHKEQTDKAGLPYVFHPFHLAEQMETEDEVCVALLHDVIEDTNTTQEDLLSNGFTVRILEALTLMTHDKDIPYLDYIAQIKLNPIAVKVKLADLQHNSDTTRLDIVDNKAERRIAKYKEAIILLKG